MPSTLEDKKDEDDRNKSYTGKWSNELVLPNKKFNRDKNWILHLGNKNQMHCYKIRI